MDCMRPTHTGKGNLLYSIHRSKCFLSPRNTRIDSPRIMYDQLSGHPTAPVKSTHKPNHYKSLIWWSSPQLTSTQEAQRRSLEVREWSPWWQDSPNSQREREEFPFLKCVRTAKGNLEQQKLVEWGTYLSSFDQPGFPNPSLLPGMLRNSGWSFHSEVQPAMSSILPPSPSDSPPLLLFPCPTPQIRAHFVRNKLLFRSSALRGISSHLICTVALATVTCS